MDVNNKIGVLKIGKFYKTQKGKKVFIFFALHGEIFSGVIEGEAFARQWYKDGKSFTWHNAFKDNIIKEWRNK